MLGRGQPIHAGQVVEHVCRAGAGHLQGLLLLVLLLLRLQLLLLRRLLRRLLGLLLLLLRRWGSNCTSLQHLKICLLHLQAMKMPFSMRDCSKHEPSCLHPSQQLSCRAGSWQR